jgi:hypothetical protein
MKAHPFRLELDMDNPSPVAARANPAFRSSQRLTITVAQATLEALVNRSSFEGRSLSNLAAYLLEAAMEERRPHRSVGPQP